MKRFVILALMICMASTLGLAVASGASAAPKQASPFVGKWETTDIYDGSYMQMKISGHHQLNHVEFVDDWASLCPDGGPATVIGKVTYSDSSTMEMDYRVRCQIGNYKMEGSVGFTYQLADDVLIDSWGNTWTRM